MKTSLRVQPDHLSLPGAGLAVLTLALPWLNPFEPGPAEAAVQGLLSLLALGVLLLVPWRADGPTAMARVLAASWLVAALLSTVLALIQFAGAASQWAPWVNQAPPGIVYGNLRQRNHFASLISLGLVALIWLAARRGKPAAAPSWAWVLAAAWLGLGNGLSSSRTGLLELVLLLGLFGLMWRRSQAPGLPRLLLAAAAGYALAVLVLQSGLLTRLQTEPAACGSRLALWPNVLYLIGQQPLTGWGWGGLIYAQFITLFPGLRFCGLMDNAHNLPLQLAVEFGVPAATLVCGYVLWKVVLARPWAEQDRQRQWAWAGLAVIGLHSLLEYPLSYGPFQLAAVGCLLALLPTSSDPASRWGRFWRLAAAWRVGVAVGVLALAAFATQCYLQVRSYYPPSGQRLAPFAEGYMATQPRPWLFGEWLDFAEVANTPVTTTNAAHMLALSERVVQWRPVPAIIEPLLRSAVLAQRHDLALAYVERYKAAYPPEYAEWAKLNEKK
ncbi:MAG: Wzy polymerase domain-containing protein [Betaproteobacteria bacterium]